MKKILLLSLAVMLLCWSMASAATPTISRNSNSAKIDNKSGQALESTSSTKFNDQAQKAPAREKQKSKLGAPAPIRNNDGAATVISDGRSLSDIKTKKEMLKKIPNPALAHRQNAGYNGPATMPYWFTPESITDIILTEDFENGGNIPVGWTDCCDNTDPWLYNGGNPDFGPSTPHGGSYAAFFDIYNYAYGTTDTLISASMDLSSHSGSYVVSFWYFDFTDPEGIQDSVTVFVCENGANTYLAKLPQNVPAWTQFVYAFSSTSSNVTIKFGGYSLYGYTNPYIDDFEVAEFVNMGRCCYGDTLDPSCADNTQEECTALGGTWTYGDSCAGDPCPAVIVGDNCSAPFEITSFPYTDTRNTADFNNDVNPEYIGGDVVYRFTITEPMLMNIGLCNTADPFSTYMGVWREGNCGAGNYDIQSSWGECAAYWELASISDAVFAAGTYYIMIEPSWNATADGIYTLDVTAVPSTPVIDFQVTAPGQWEGSTIGAGDDCGLGASEDQVWEVTIPYDATWIIALCNTPVNWDSRIFVGSSYCNSDIAYNDDGCGSPGYYLPRIVTPLTAGVYYVTIESWNPDNPGPYILDITEAPPPPPNDNCADVNPADYPLSDNVPMVYTGDNSNATQDCPANGLSEVWIPFSTSECMDVTINYCGTIPTPGWANITLYSDCPCGEAIWDNADNWEECGDGNWTLHFYHLPPGNYYYPLNADLTWDPTGPYTCTVIGTVCQPPPENDLCANASPIGNVENLPFSTISALFDGNGSCIYSANVWYVYTAECDGMGLFSLCGSEFDTKIAVYDGVTCEPLPVELSCNDDACGLKSQAILPVIAGHQYLIEVGGYDTYAGNGILTTACGPASASDNCVDVNPADYPLSSSVPVIYEGNNINATNDCDQLAWAQVWIPFSTDTCMDVTISSCGTSPALYTLGTWLFSDCPCGDYIALDTYNGTECGDGNWTAYFYNLPAGDYYYPLYSDSAQGFYTITVTGELCAPPPPDPCLNAYYSNGAFDGIGDITSDRNIGLDFETWAADDVVLSEEVTISSISWYCVTDISYDFQYTADITIMEDAGGTPGAPVLELTDVAATRIATREYLFEIPVFYYTISGLNFTLGPGAFWIALRPVNQGTIAQNFWLTAPLTGSMYYFKSAYFGYPDWVPATDLGLAPANVSFCFSTQGAGCAYIPGDINGNGATNGIDVVYGVNYFKGGPMPPDSCNCPPAVFPFYAAGDVNANCNFNGIDITFFVNFLKGTVPALLSCPTCPPEALLETVAPAVMPIKTPILKSNKENRQTRLRG